MKYFKSKKKCNLWVCGWKVMGLGWGKTFKSLQSKSLYMQGVGFLSGHFWVIYTFSLVLPYLWDAMPAFSAPQPLLQKSDVSKNVDCINQASLLSAWVFLSFFSTILASQKRLGHKILGFFTHRNKSALVCTFFLMTNYVN